MKRKEIDWSILRRSLILLVICIIFCGGIIFGSYYFYNQMQLEYRRHNAQFQDISKRYLAVDEEEKIIKKFYPRFIELHNKGIIGKEHRLNWVEVLRKSGDKITLPLLNYVIKSQNKYTPGFAVNLGRYQLRSSNMTLTMQLLHEEDLFYLFDELDTYADGLYSIAACEMSSSVSEITDDPKASNITVKCELQWFTITLADGKDLEV
jgi:hypothetical protein